MPKTLDELAPKGTTAHYISIADARALTLEAAGYNPEEVGRFLRLATEKLLAKLDARKTQFFTSDGKVTDSRDCEDNTAQIKAAEALLVLGVDVMALKRRSSDEKPKMPDITIDLSGWTVQPPMTSKDTQ